MNPKQARAALAAGAMHGTPLDDMPMSPLFAKLNLKQQREILVLDAPASFEPELAGLAGITVVRDPKQVAKASFALVFATSQVAVDALSRMVGPLLEGDAILWFAYPKGSSKKYRCDFNRDSGWSVLRALGFDTVRQVAIDEDWSALRFRRVEYIGR